MFRGDKALQMQTHFCRQRQAETQSIYDIPPSTPHFNLFIRYYKQFKKIATVHPKTTRSPSPSPPSLPAQNQRKPLQRLRLPFRLFICISIFVDYNFIFPMVLVDENPYYYAAIGGILLGLATTLNYALRGRVTGMSGAVYGILTLHKQDLHEKLSIIGGMLVASGVFFDIFGYGTINSLTPFGAAEKITTQTSYLGYALAGLLVGFGTKLSNGCTSGHGLCGLPRLSIRSFVAVCVFLVTAIAISTLRYHSSLGPFSSEDINPQFEYNHIAGANVCLALGALLPVLGGVIKAHLEHNKMTNREIVVDQIITFAVGAIFGVGLLVSGMVRRSNILGFLGLGQEWNPSLLFVLGCGVMVNLLTFNYMLRVRKESFLGRHLFNPENKVIDWRLISGAFCFGLGWGIGGLCPGPAIMQFSVFSLPVHVLWVGCMLVGMGISRKLEHYLHQLQEQEKEKKRVEQEELAKPHHLHHHKHPHRHDHDVSIPAAELNLHNPHDLPPLRANQLPQIEPYELNPMADLFKQDSASTMQQTVPQNMRSTSMIKLSSEMESPTKLH